MNIELIIQEYGYIAIFLFLLLNGFSGVPSSPLVYVPASIYILRGTMSFEAVVFIGSLGSCLGNIILYECVRKKIPLANYLRHRRQERLSRRRCLKFNRYFQKNPTPALIIGKFIPIIKVVVPILAGKFHINRLLFGTIMLASNTVWAYLVVGPVVYGERIFTAIDNKIGFFVGISLVITFYLRRSRQKSSSL